MPTPLACKFDKGGAIDPTFLADPITNLSYVIFKDDGNAIGSGGACGNGNFPNTATTFEFDVVDPNDYTTRLGNDTFTPTYSNASSKALSGSRGTTSTALMTNTRHDGANIESPQLWYHDYSTAFTNSSTTAYHMLYNSGCFNDPSYAIRHVVCWITSTDPYTNSTQTSDQNFRTCTWDKFKDDANTTHQADTLYETGVYPQPDGLPDAHLYAPGGPGIDQEGKYMVFHADLEPQWFVEPNKYKRTRGMFVAELQYAERQQGKGTGLKVKRLIVPNRD